jgi:HD-like signal output (HDOD) protein
MTTTSLPATATVESLISQLRAFIQPSPILPLLDDLLHDPAASAEDVARVMALDPTVAMRVVRAVNSAYFALPEPITSLSRAVPYIGFEVVHEIARHPSLLSLFTLRVMGRADLNARIAGLWQHSVATAVAARILARRQGALDDLPYVAAALAHDAGKVAFLLLLPDAYEHALKMAATESLPIVTAERRWLPCDHATLGRAICQAWGQPEEIALAVGRHHGVRSGGRLEACSELAAAVQVADILARALGAGWWGDRVMPRLEPAARVALNLQAGDARTLLDALEADYPRALATLGALYTPRPLAQARA